MWAGGVRRRAANLLSISVKTCEQKRHRTADFDGAQGPNSQTHRGFLLERLTLTGLCKGSWLCFRISCKPDSL